MTDIDKNEHNICESTTRACPCTFDCPHHGKCCDCVAHHRDHNEGVPGCSFPKRQKLPTTEVLKPSAATAE